MIVTSAPAASEAHRLRAKLLAAYDVEIWIPAADRFAKPRPRCVRVAPTTRSRTLAKSSASSVRESAMVIGSGAP